MGTYYQWVADLDATEAHAPLLGQRVVADLVARGVLLPDRSPNAALGADGYPAGPAWGQAVVASASGEQPWGLEVREGRALHDGSQFSVDAVTCPRCSAVRSFYGHPDVVGPTGMDEDGLDQFHEAANEWVEGGAADLECRECGAAEPVERWGADGAALACLAFVFWEWDELRPETLGWIAEATGGHRIVTGPGKV
ncbi:hypothetical protein [Promicromonospora sp. NPDC050880]|uniref:hypothetical protein n=1 Tax=Promicromonospora sp. NPDC050880 TaxID=3364406 RepID=UPI0037B7A7CE